MTGTAPWHPNAEAAIRQTLTVVVEARATHPDWPAPIRLDVQSGSVTFDEQWSPHVRADLECALPDDDAIDALDPRDLVRIEIDAGYVYPGGARDVHRLVDLGLRDRTVARPASTMQVIALSDEALLQDANVSTEFLFDPSWPLSDMLPARLPPALGYTPTLDVSACPTTPVPLLLDSSHELWAAFKQACDVAGAWLRDRGDRTWVASLWPTRAGDPVHALRTGPTGTIVTSDVTQARDGWANVVTVTYVGETESVTGWAWVTGPRQGITGPNGDTLPGIRLYQEQRDGSATVDQAAAAAASILRRFLRSGRTATTSAISAFWVRPGTTVTVTLPHGDTETHLVAQVSFDLAHGEMTVHTRQPDDTPISTGA